MIFKKPINVRDSFKLKLFGCMFAKFLVNMAKDLDRISRANLQEIFEVPYIIKAPKNYAPKLSLYFNYTCMKAC